MTREGDVVFHSYRGSEYVGPRDVLKNFDALLATISDARTAKRAGHRLAVLQHVRSAGKGSAKPRPYFVEIDPKRYQSLEVKKLTARLEIDARGKVTDARFEPELPAALEWQIEEDARQWLFLPAVRDGQAVPLKVQLPVEF